ncbi:hypothetical protein ACFX1Q_036555 [Malus domestica]
MRVEGIFNQVTLVDDLQVVNEVAKVAGHCWRPCVSEWRHLLGVSSGFWAWSRSSNLGYWLGAPSTWMGVRDHGSKNPRVS